MTEALSGWRPDLSRRRGVLVGRLGTPSSRTQPPDGGPAKTDGPKKRREKGFFLPRIMSRAANSVGAEASLSAYRRVRQMFLPGRV